MFEPETCMSCGEGSYYVYYNKAIAMYEYFSGNSNCSGEFTSGGMIDYFGQCEHFQQSCVLSYIKGSGNVYTGEFTTTSSLRVGSFTAAMDYLRMNITTQSASMVGYLQHVKIETENTKFRFKKIVNSTSFKCNYGILDFGTLYTFDDLTFTIYLNIDPLLSNRTSFHQVIITAFEPLNIQITEDFEYKVAFNDIYTLAIETNRSYSLLGVEIGVLNWFELHNLYVIPPSDDSEEAHLAYQVVTQSDYIIRECDVDYVGAIQCDFTRDEVLALAAAAGNFPSWVLFSPYYEQTEEIQNVDEMAFSLF